MQGIVEMWELEGDLKWKFVLKEDLQSKWKENGAGSEWGA